MENFDLFLDAFLNVILQIKNNDLDGVKSTVEILNIFTDSEILHIGDADIFNMAINNESFRYFLQNFKTLDIQTLKSMWDLENNFIYDDYLAHKINLDELLQIIQSYIDDKDSPIYKYRYLGLTRLALINKNYDLIFKMKQILNNVEGNDS